MAVSSLLTTRQDFETSPTFTNIGSGGGASANTDVFIEGIQSGGRRVDNATAKGFMGNITSFNGGGLHVRQWVYCFHWSAVTAITARIASGASAYDNHVFPVADLPKISGWLPMWMDVSRVPDSTGTSGLDETAIIDCGYYVDIGNVGGAGDNVILDFISSGSSGLRWTGTGPGDFADFTTYDDTNNIGAILDLFGGAKVQLARLEVGGTAAESDFTDSGFTVLAGDQPLVGADFVGLTIHNDHASSVCSLSNGTYGSVAPVDASNRPDLLIPDTAGTVTCDTVSFPGLRRVLANNKVSFLTCNLSKCGQVDPQNGDYSGEMDLPGTDEYMDTTTNVDVNSTSGDFEIIMLIEPDDWTPAATEALASHYAGAANTTSFRLQLNGSTQLVLIVGDGTTTTTLTSTALTNMTDGDAAWIRVTYDQSAGQANFYYARYQDEPVDTPAGDISWTATGTPTGTSRTMPSQSRPILLGAENSGTPAAFFDGRIMYFEFWNDGFRATGASHGDLISKLDLRTGPDFAGTPSVRADSFSSSLTWEEQGSAPAYSLGSNGTAAADFDSSTFSESRSEVALFWNVNADPDGELDDTVWASDGTGHAIELGPNCPTTITLRRFTTTGYAGSDGSTGNETIYNNSGKTITINFVGWSGQTTVRNGTGASTTKVIDPVTCLFNVKNENGANLQNARVMAEANNGSGDLPFEASVGITRSATTATVSHTAHGLATNEKVVIRGCDQTEYNGVKQITVTGPNEYTYTVSGSPATPATGSPESTGVVLEGLTDVNGQISASRAYSLDQSIRYRIAIATTSPRYKRIPSSGSGLVDTIDNTNGLTVTQQMVRDD